MKILVTGSKGQLGLEIAYQLKGKKDVELFLTDINELDISNHNSVSKVVREVKPNIIINCAAYTAVDNCETETDSAYRINTIGPRNLAIASLEVKSKLIHISTDYVFSGEGAKDKDGNIRPYNEFDPPDPNTLYGKSKLEGEQFVQRIAPFHFIFRTAWLYGEGNNFVRTMLNLSKERDVIKVVNDQYGSPTSTSELAKAVIITMNTDNYGLFHSTCEGHCTWFDFTKEIFGIKGIKTKLEPITSEEFPRPAKRPKYSVLENYMFHLTTNHKFTSWKDEIKEYLDKL